MVKILYYKVIFQHELRLLNLYSRTTRENDMQLRDLFTPWCSCNRSKINYYTHKNVTNAHFMGILELVQFVEYCTTTSFIWFFFHQLCFWIFTGSRLNCYSDCLLSCLISTFCLQTSTLIGILVMWKCLCFHYLDKHLYLLAKK